MKAPGEPGVTVAAFQGVDAGTYTSHGEHMTGQTGKRLAALLLSAGLLACASNRSIAPALRADLNGSWLLNAAESEGTPPDTMPSRSGTVNRVQGRATGGGLIGPPRSITMAAGDMHRALNRLKRTSTKIRITHDDSLLVITYEDTSRMQLRLNGQKTSFYWFGVGQVEAKASWQSDGLHVERRLVDGNIAMQEIYSLAPGTNRLIVVTEAEGGLVRDRRWRRVYERNED